MPIKLTIFLLLFFYIEKKRKEKLFCYLNWVFKLLQLKQIGEECSRIFLFNHALSCPCSQTVLFQYFFIMSSSVVKWKFIDNETLEEEIVEVVSTSYLIKADDGNVYMQHNSKTYKGEIDSCFGMFFYTVIADQITL